VDVSAKTVYLHVGLPKTGTTYLQSVLWENRAALASAGCLVPGEGRGFAWLAASDVLGRRPQGAEAPTVAGSWRAFVDAVAGFDGDRAILSEELLVTANKRQLRRIVSSLRPADVHVVVSVRDLARTLPSVWQQEIRKGRTWSWPEFLSALRDPDTGPPTAGASFWLRFDVQRTLRAWEGLIAPEHVHVVLVPPPGAPSGVLLTRFGTATGLDTAGLTAPVPDLNTALGVAETEVLRRLNTGLGGRLNERQYTRVVAQSIVPALQERPAAARAMVPVEYEPWVRERSEALIAFLGQRPYDIQGDLDDLRPQSPREPATGSAHEPTLDRATLGDSDLVEPLTVALVAATGAFGQFWWRARKSEEARDADVATRLTSRVRALGYQAKVGVLERADTNPVFGRLVRGYVKRRSSQG
jgi:hypothetical protein